MLVFKAWILFYCKEGMKCTEYVEQQFLDKKCKENATKFFFETSAHLGAEDSRGPACTSAIK